MFKVNSLDILGVREVINPPLHFEYTILSIPYHKVELIKNWISCNLKSRFYFRESLEIDNNKYVIKFKLGFENHKELSFFLLACPHLN